MDPELFKNVHSRPSVDYMLRTQQQNNVLLMQIADQKANILIGLTAIMLTLVMSKFSTDTLTLPIMIFSGFSVLAALFALLTLLPRITKVGPDESKQGNSRLLYFNYVSKLGKQDYLAQMSQILRDDDAIYDAITGDIYYQAMVLKKKYRYLRVSYLLFAFGIMLTFFLWVMEHLSLLAFHA
jgi:hypothetical protein